MAINISMDQNNIERAILWNSLTNLGDFVKTKLTFPQDVVQEKLKAFEDKWVLYNQYPNTTVNNRWGMPITSADGSVDSATHLEQWWHYRKNIKDDKETYQDWYADESDFTVPTEVYYAIPEIGNIVDLFAPDIGRVHFLKVGPGGYFPPHRDFPGHSPEWVRLLAVFGNCQSHEYGHVLDGQLRYPLPGMFYFINFQLEHCMFSFTDSVYAVMLTIKLTQRSHDILLSHIGR